MKKAIVLAAMALTMNAGAVVSAQASPEASPSVTVYSMDACEGYEGWAEDLQDYGFSVDVIETDDVSEIQQDFGVPLEYRDCFVAIAEDYFVQGHVSAERIQEALDTFPEIRGLVMGDNGQVIPVSL